MDYLKYDLSKKEWAMAIGIYALGILAISYFFYRSWVVFLLLSPGFYLFFKYYKNMLIKKRKKKLVEEFSEVLFSVSVNIKAGYSVENAFLEAYKDIKLFYGENSLMADEIMRIKKGMEINITLEDLIEDLAKRSHEKDILLFSEVCKSAKRNGGNITEVLLNTAERIRGGINVDKEIDTLLSEKKLELRIMEIMPFFIMMYLEVTSVGYFNVLYQDYKGRILMTACLLGYMGAVYVGKRILDIEV